MSQIAGKTPVTLRTLVRLMIPVWSVFLFMQGADAVAQPPFLAGLSKIKTLTSTIPGNGDVNPYGVAVVPVKQGALDAGNILVSNFNDVSNLQGKGTTIVQISPSGSLTPFATITARSLQGHGSCPGGVGLTTALVALQSGFVIVGSLPTSDGTAATAQAGCLIVLDSNGNVVMTLSGNGINGPWDMTALEMGTSVTLFVTNVLNGTVAANGAVVSQGSVLRIGVSTSGGGFTPTSFTTIASTFDERTDPAALVIGPTGLGLEADGTGDFTLFVADTLRSRVAAISKALTRPADAMNGATVREGGDLKSPLGLAIAPNGDILTVNAGTALIVGTTPNGRPAGSHFIDVSHSRNGAGTLFGLAVAPDGDGVYFVDDGNNTLNILGDGKK